jgi:hypothetical protein
MMTSQAQDRAGSQHKLIEEIIIMIIVIKKDGSQTGPMAQIPTAQTYLQKVLLEAGGANRVACLNQALNDVGGGKGKASGAYKFNNHPVLHASSGSPGKGASVTILFYRADGNEYIFAMGCHTGASSYELDIYGQNQNPTFKQGAKLKLS